MMEGENSIHVHSICHNPSLELTTKARLRKSASQERDPGMLENVRMNTPTPKWTPILGVGVPMDFQNFREWLQGSKPFSLKSSLYQWKVIEA